MLVKGNTNLPWEDNIKEGYIVSYNKVPMTTATMKSLDKTRQNENPIKHSHQTIA